MVLAQREAGSVAGRVEGLDRIGINHAHSNPRRDTKIFLAKRKGRCIDPSGKIFTRIPSKGNLTGLKKPDFNSGNQKDLEVWTDTSRRLTWTPKCLARGLVDGMIRKPIT